jgi:hypothetical protein
MTRFPPLTRIVAWAQQLAGETLRPGDLAVDLTAGAGRDTLFLWQQVGPTGRVLAFDVQPAAIEQTALLLEEAGAAVTRHPAPPPGGFPPGVHLVRDSHAHLDRYLAEAPRAVVANLGYLPGGDPALTTLPSSTLTALEQALARLASGGRLCVVAYPGHPGGEAEAQAVEALFAGLPSASWQVLRLAVANVPNAPFLLAAERK